MFFLSFYIIFYFPQAKRENGGLSAFYINSVQFSIKFALRVFKTKECQNLHIVSYEGNRVVKNLNMTILAKD